MAGNPFVELSPSTFSGVGALERLGMSSGNLRSLPGVLFKPVTSLKVLFVPIRIDLVSSSNFYHYLMTVLLLVRVFVQYDSPAIYSWHERRLLSFLPITSRLGSQNNSRQISRFVLSTIDRDISFNELTNLPRGLFDNNDLLESLF
jgi:hypothetical protein